MKITTCCFCVSMFLMFASTSLNTRNLTHELRELPCARDSFETVRVNDKVYVDKSAFITKLLKRREKFVRICRPQRFGKSNFIQMLRAFFSGNKTLFEGLTINVNQSWRFSYPVVYFDFNRMNVNSVEDLTADLRRVILQVAESNGVVVNETASVATQLRDLVLEFAKIKRRPYHLVVVLVDEYDWPVRRHADINDQAKVQEMGDLLQEFFGAIQSVRSNIRFLFMTCTTPLDLDYYSDGDGLSLVDFTYDPEFNELIGLTHEELASHFKPHIDRMAGDTNETFRDIVERMRKRYDGYCFSPNVNSTCHLGVYNFDSVISCLRNGKGHSTGNPKLVSIIDRFPKDENRRRTFKHFTNFTISRAALERCDHVDQPVSMVVCMILYGYLTYRGYDVETRHFVVDFPNDEMRERFLKEVLERLPVGNLPANDIFAKCAALRSSMSDGKWQKFVELLNGMAFEVEDGTLDARSENEYVDRVIRVFQVCDLDSQHEYAFYRNDYSVAGTVDLIAREWNESVYRYVFEFECRRNASYAADKLLNFAAVQEFVNDLWHRKISFVGLTFGEKGGAIDEWIGLTYVDGRCVDLQASHSHYVDTYARTVPC